MASTEESKLDAIEAAREAKRAHDEHGFQLGKALARVRDLKAFQAVGRPSASAFMRSDLNLDPSTGRRFVVAADLARKLRLTDEDLAGVAPDRLHAVRHVITRRNRQGVLEACCNKTKAELRVRYPLEVVEPPERFDGDDQLQEEVEEPLGDELGPRQSQIGQGTVYEQVTDFLHYRRDSELHDYLATVGAQLGPERLTADLVATLAESMDGSQRSELARRLACTPRTDRQKKSSDDR